MRHTSPSPRQFPEDFKLLHGSHNSAEEGMCLLEATAYLAGEPHSDSPQCACPVLASFGRRVNDRLNDESRQRLAPFASLLIGTRSTQEVEQKRAFLFADYAVRVFAPLALEARGYKEHAEKLRTLPEIVDRASALVARAAAYAADDAASSATYAAATYAAAAAADATYAATYAAAAAYTDMSSVVDAIVECFKRAIAIT